MSVFVGTESGLYEASPGEGTDATVLLEDVAVRQLTRSATGDGIYAATTSGLYRSTDGGDSWTDLGVPHDEIASVKETPDGRALFAGTQPAHLYRSTDGGESWSLCESFDRLPGKETWEQLGPGGPQVRDMATHPRAPGRLFVAVEAEGVYLTPDYGDSWEYRSFGLHDDPHHIHSLDRRSLVAACGRGLYRTTDAGHRWHRLDTHRDLFWHTYYREALTRQGILYASAQDRSEQRHEPSGSGVIVTSTDRGRSLTLEDEFPGQSGDFVNAWAAHETGPVAGTVGGRLLLGPEPWDQRARFEGEIRSLAAHPERSG